MNLKEKILADPEGKSLVNCFSCGMCTGGCPVARISDYNPRRIIHRVMLDMEPEDIWLCANCYTCEERCPTKTNVADLINLMRRIIIKKDGLPEFIKPIVENLEVTGYIAKIGELENKRRERMNLPVIETTDEIKKIIQKTK